jgi:hypothetical protein
MAIEAECADIMIVISLRDSTLALHRMHKAKLRVWQEFVDQPNFPQGCNIIMRDAGFPQGFKQRRRWVRFHGIQGFTLKLLNEETGRARSSMWAE